MTKAEPKRTKRVRTEAYRAWEREYKRKLYRSDPNFRAKARQRTNNYRRALWKTKEGRKRLQKSTLSWAWNNPEQYAASALKAGLKHRLKNYGSTLAAYQTLLKQQKGRCAICKSKKPGIQRRGRKQKTKTIYPSIRNKLEVWNVDHCHSTKKIRGLLCHHCNAGLGYFKDNPKLLLAAAKYISLKP
jgi:hypothetical protein